MPRVLLVDDDFDILDALKSILELTYEVDVAANGMDALTKLAAGAYDAIVLDLMMPVMDGETFLRSLRASGSKIPVVIASAGANLQAITQSAGANDFVAKPFNVAQLEGKLAKLIGSGGPGQSGGTSGGTSGGSGSGAGKPGPLLMAGFGSLSAVFQRADIWVLVPSVA